MKCIGFPVCGHEVKNTRKHELMAAKEGVFEENFDSCVRGYHVYQDEWMPVV